MAKSAAVVPAVPVVAKPSKPESSGFGSMFASFLGDCVETGAEVASEVHGAIDASGEVYDFGRQISYLSRAHKAKAKALARAAALGITLQLE